jgi:hypothetical protein
VESLLTNIEHRTPNSPKASKHLSASGRSNVELGIEILIAGIYDMVKGTRGIYNMNLNLSFFFTFLANMNIDFKYARNN